MVKITATITDAESTLLLAQLYTHKDGLRSQRNAIRNFAIGLIMLDAGLRVGEACRIRRNNVMYAGEIAVSITIPAAISKNKIERTIPVTDRLKAALQKVHSAVWIFDGGAPDAYCFYGSKPDGKLTVRQVQRIIGLAAEKCLKRPLHPHILRHTFATNLLKVTNIRVVQKLLGHTSITSTQVYTHPSDQDLAEAINNMHQ